MENSKYLDKMNNLLADKKTYKKIKSDPTDIFQNKNKEIIDSWEKNNFISPYTAKKLNIRTKNIWFTKIT